MLRAERLNALAALNSAKRYLEVGVCKGETFFDVKVEHKVAVDPVFLFDFKSSSSVTAEFHEMTSDVFFATANPQTFDLIYLDGLHTFEQTLKDFLNSLLFAHDKTIWLIDDTFPNDCFSALPDPERCYRLRHSLQPGDWSWMGDVYKLIFFIKAVMRFYHFRTFKGHGQTVVWKSAKMSAETKVLAVDQITAMTYMDFIDFTEMMNISEDGIIYYEISKWLESTNKKI